MKQKNMLFVLNPHSGKVKIKNKLLYVINKFSEKGYNITIHATQKSGDATEIIKKSGGFYDLVVVSGGDGTLSEAVSGLMNIEEFKRPCLGYIPSGTTNDFASGFGIPKNIERACEVIISGSENKCDVGKFAARYFSYVAAFGAFTEVTYDTPQQIKNALGYAAYVVEGIKRLGSIKPHHLRVECNDGTVIEDDFLFGMITNSLSVAGFKYSKKLKVSLNDGVFECILVKMPGNPIELQMTVSDFLTQKFDSDRFYMLKFDKARIISDNSIDWTLDGEFGGSHTDVFVENIQGAISIIS